MKPHYDTENKISIILEGGLQEKSSKTHIHAGTGSLVIKPTHVKHENLFNSKKTTILSLNFSKDFLFPDELNSWEWLSHPKVYFQATKLWYNLKSTKNDKQLSFHLHAFINFLTQVKARSHSKLTDSISKIKTILDSPDMFATSIGKMSKENGLDRSYVSRAFAKHFSVSPVEYRKYVRLNHLLKSLSDEKRSLTDIAYEYNFSDQSHMSRIIQRELNMTPRKFRLLSQM